MSKIIGSIKCKKSTIRNQSIIKTKISSTMVLQRGKIEKKYVLKKGGFSKSSQLNYNGGFGYI
jgi:hypothetical protein